MTIIPFFHRTEGKVYRKKSRVSQFAGECLLTGLRYDRICPENSEFLMVIYININFRCKKTAEREGTGMFSGIKKEGHE